MRPREFAMPALSRRNFMRGGAGLAAGAALAGTPLSAAFAQARAGRDLWPAVASFTDEYVRGGKVASMVSLLGFGQDKPVTIASGPQTQGMSTPAGIDSLYRIYSMTKPVTGIAAIMLVDEGKMQLDQPVADFIPGFADTRVLKNPKGSLEDTEPMRTPLTVRHLLTHTGGIGYDIVSEGPIRAAYVRRGISSGQVTKLPIPGLSGGTTAPSLEVYANRLAELPLVYQPGERWSYSASLDLLGRVIEVASGMPFDEFLASRIFNPSGMESTFFQVPASERSRLTTNYGKLGDTLIPIDPASSSIYLDKPPVPWGGSGLVSSPADFDRFQRMLLGLGEIDGTRVMSARAVRLATSNLLPEGANTRGTWVDGEGFGAGGRVGTGEAEGSFGWGGAASTVAFVNFKVGLRAGMYTQLMTQGENRIHDRFPQAVLADLAQMATAAAA